MALEEIETTARDTGTEIEEEQRVYYEALNKGIAEELDRSRRREKNWERGCLIMGGALVTGIIMEVSHAMGQNEN